MKNTNNLLYSILIILLFSCSKPESDTRPVPPPPPPDPVTITSISPAHGPWNTIDTIRGNNFSTTAAQNTVYFNGKSATVLSASATQLIVSVPKLAGTGKVSVVTGNTTVIGPVFTYDTVLLVSTLAGSGTAGFVNGPASTARFNYPSNLTVDSSGNVYVCDTYNHAIRKITPDGTVSTIAGNGTIGAQNGQGSVATFEYPIGITIGPGGNLFIGNSLGDNIRKITPQGVVSTYAGNNLLLPNGPDGPADIAGFLQPYGVYADAHGNVFVADEKNNMIRKIAPDGYVTTIAGHWGGGWNNGIGTAAGFNGPMGITADQSGTVFVVDEGNHMIRKITTDGTVSTLAGSTSPGFVDGVGAAAKFYYPTDLVIDSSGNILVADPHNYAIRKIYPSGLVKTYIRFGIGDVDGPVPQAGIRQMYGLALDKQGNIYFSDQITNKIKKITYQ